MNRVALTVVIEKTEGQHFVFGICFCVGVFYLKINDLLQAIRRANLFHGYSPPQVIKS